MIALPAQVTFATAPRVLGEAAREADAALRAGAPGSVVLDVDLSRCSAFDSSLLAVLLELQRRAAAARARCRLHHSPANLRKLAALYGVDALVFAASEPDGALPA